MNELQNLQSSNGLASSLDCIGLLGGGLRLRAGSNVQDISGIFQEYSINYFKNQLLLMGRIFDGISIRMQLFVLFLFHFLMEYSKNILQVRPRPKGRV